jgi:histidine ammonia-lyase
MMAVTITEAALGIEDLLAVAGGARVELGEGVGSRIAAGRAVVDRALDAGDAVYGLTTQTVTTTPQCTHNHLYARPFL